MVYEWHVLYAFGSLLFVEERLQFRVVWLSSRMVLGMAVGESVVTGRVSSVTRPGDLSLVVGHPDLSLRVAQSCRASEVAKTGLTSDAE